MFSRGSSVIYPESDDIHSSRYCKLATSFLYKVLAALKQLQSFEKYYEGADTDTIVKFITKYHRMSGDIQSQVENALQKATQSLLVSKGTHNLYTLVVPAASIHVIPPASVPAKLEEIKQLFNYPGVSKTSARVTYRTRQNSLKYNMRRKTNKMKQNTKSRSRSKTRSRSRSPTRSSSSSPLKKLALRDKVSSSKQFEADFCRTRISRESFESDE